MDVATGGEGEARVLIVDDDTALTRALSRYLVSAGFATHTAASGVEAEAVLVKRTVDMVLTDINMPELDGFGLLRRVRDRDLALPVVLMTGSPSDELARAAFDNGATTYLLKPIEQGRLVSVTRAVVNARRVAKSRPQEGGSPPSFGPANQHFGVCQAPDGERYSFHFYGGALAVAVVLGPIPRLHGLVERVREAHREPAVSADDAWHKLVAWRRSKGW